MQQHGRGSPPAQNNPPVVGAHPTTAFTSNANAAITSQQQEQQQYDLEAATFHQVQAQQRQQPQQQELQPRPQSTIQPTISAESSANSPQPPTRPQQLPLPMLPTPQQPSQQQQQQQPSASPFASLQYASPPLIDPSPQEADSLRAGALYGLSTEERDQALADVHGVSAAGSLDNEFIATRLAQLDQAIHDLRTNKSAYLRAKIQSPDYVANRTFRLQFLLADSFQPVAAAERLVSYFESKLVLFGPDNLTKDLTMQDLDAEDVACLEHGLVQRLVGRDHAGRVVVSCWPTASTSGTAMAGPVGLGAGGARTTSTGASTGGGVTATAAASALARGIPPDNRTTVSKLDTLQANTSSDNATTTTAANAGGAAVAPPPGPLPDDPLTGMAVARLRSATASMASLAGDSQDSADADPDTSTMYHDHYVRYECDQIIDVDHWKHQLKALWYMVTTIVDEEQEAAHRNGFVSVVFGMGPHGNADRLALWKMMYLFRSLPVRVASIHYCYDDPQSKSLANLSVLALDPKSRARFRTHYGSHDTVVAELSSFGIGSNLLTVDPRSEEAIMVIREWFATRRLKESTQAARKTAPSTTSVSDVGHYDVLFGRGKGIQAHPGNKRLRELVEANLDRYERASRLEKTLMAETIVRNIKDTSGRFLKLDSASRGGGWTQVNDEVARDKIAHAFRTQRKSLLQREKESTLARANPAPSPIPFVSSAPAAMLGADGPSQALPSENTTGGSGPSQFMDPHDPSQYSGGSGAGPHMY